MRGTSACLIIIATLTGCGRTDPATSLAKGPFLGGVTVPSWQRGEYSSPAATKTLAEVRATGASWVALTPTSFQRGASDTRVPYDTDATATPDDLRRAIAAAHARGLAVLLKPTVDVVDDAGKGDWRGTIGRSFGATEWAAWFRGYETWLLRHAQLAAACDVEALCVGTELSTASRRTKEWRDLVAKVRAAYRGKLVFAANWDAIDDVGFWDVLDWVGVDPYFPLSRAERLPSVEELARGWKPHVDHLASVARRAGRPVVFTELGFRSVDGAWRDTWEWEKAGGKVDLEAQRRLYRATALAFADQGFLQGFFLWAWNVGDHGGPSDTGFSPRGKPAEADLRTLFSLSLTR